MNPRVMSVQPNSNYTITLTFTNGEIKTFDVQPYLGNDSFRQLSDPSIFNAVRPFLGSIQWPNGLDFCPDTLYEESVPCEIVSQ